MKKLFLFGTAATSTLWAQPAVVDLYSSPGSQATLGAGRFFFAVFCGILLAYAFQWILTSLSMATGITALKPATRKRRDRRSTDRQRERDEKEEDTPRETIQKVETGAGIWGLVTTCISLFFACWIAVETVRTGSRWETVALGLTIWAGFFLSMMLIDALALGSALGAIYNVIKSAGKTALAPVQSLASGVGNMAAQSADQIAAQVRKEMEEGGGTSGIKDKFQSYLQGMPSRSIDRKSVESGSAPLFDGEIKEMARQGLLKPVDRSKFEEMVSARGDLSREEARELAETLHSRWNRVVSESRPETSWSAVGAGGDRMGDPFHDMAGASTAQSSHSPQGAPMGETAYTPSTGAATGGAGGTRVSSAVASRTQGFRDFLRNSDKRELNPVRLEQEMQAIVVSEEGGPSPERGIRELNREDLVSVLRQRRDITLQEADSIADLIDAARARMLSRTEMQEHRVQETMNEAMAKIRDFVYSLKRPDPDYEGVKNDLSKLFSDPKAGVDSLKGRLASLDRESMIDMLTQRGNLSREEAEKLAAKAEEARTQVLENSEKIEKETRRRLEEAKRMAAETAETTRAAAATAAWWLCAIAVVSAAASALGGLTGRY
jgi:hypothetical protein